MAECQLDITITCTEYEPDKQPSFADIIVSLKAEDLIPNKMYQYSHEYMSFIYISDSAWDLFNVWQTVKPIFSKHSDALVVQFQVEDISDCDTLAHDEYIYDYTESNGRSYDEPY